MSIVLTMCPGPPEWRVPWDDLRAAYAWVRDLHTCPQDRTHHPEGDVGTHTRMVAEALAALPAWRGLPADERAVVFAAAVLHDVAKPACTRVEAGGRISSRGHSRRGAVMARQILWREGVPFGPREQVAALVRHHQAPYFLVDRPDARRLAIEVSQTARCDLLALLAEADVRGRLSADRPRLLDNVALFAEFCREEGSLTAPFPFASDHARFLFFRSLVRQPESPAHEDFRAEVTVLSGLPGVGKDTWLRTHAPELPVVSLDALREELDVDPAGEQGRVIQEAREQARDYLRRGQSFAWNATNLSRQLREQVVRLLADYHARVRIVYLEVPAEALVRQNRQRTSPVPQTVLERLLDRWEVPDRTEAHEVEYIVRAEKVR